MSCAFVLNVVHSKAVDIFGDKYVSYFILYFFITYYYSKIIFVQSKITLKMAFF